MNSKAFLVTGMTTSFIVASMLNVYPLKYTFGIRPMFLVMVLAFWVMYRSNMMSVWAVFLVGIGCDLLLGTHLGHQAFCAVAMAFSLRLMLLYTKELTLVQSWVLAALGLGIYQTLLWILQAFSHHVFTWMGIGSLVSSIALFPLFWFPLYWVNSKHKDRAY